jgi:hypothetical protein
MPSMPATTGTIARSGARKRANTTLVAPCFAKYWRPASSTAGCVLNGQRAAIVSR